jgi:dipeptidyl aminopeptidase/acylaminoacyl peptidase
MQPEDLSQLTVPSDPQLHPDGVRTAFVLTRIDLEEDGYRRQIHLHDGDSVQEFTTGQIDALPRWSPDGKHLAFLRATDVKKPIPQLAVMPAAGGEARLLTRFDLGVEYLAWAPDGRWICVAAKSWAPELADLADEERGRRAKRISTFPYRFDNRGWLNDRRRQLWLVDPTGGEEPRRLTDGDYDEMFPAWHPDGDRIAFVTDRGPRRGLEAGSDIFEITLDGQLIRPTGRGGWVLPVYSTEGGLYLIGDPQADYPRLAGLWRAEPDGSTSNAFPTLDRSIISLAGGLPALPKWREGVVYTVVEDSGRMGVRKFGPDGVDEPVLSGDRLVTGFDIGKNGRVVASVSSTTEPGEIISVADGDEQRLTLYSPPSGIAVRPTEHFRTTSDSEELDVFVVLPEGEGPFPVLLNIHGGPATQYGFGFFDEFQVYAGAGYGVVAPNPRGSSGRGLGFTRAVVGETWGVVDLADIDAALEAALRRFPQLDRERIGIMGGSYGGYMTAWAIAHDQKYRSAIVERALLSFPSFAGTSDIGPFFGPNYIQTTDLVPMWSKSPLSVVDRIRTPTLIIHSEEDFRCPIEQAEQFLVALWQNNVPAEMLRFPGEGHELSRSGKPKHRVERFQSILAWHDKYLKSVGSNQ